MLMVVPGLLGGECIWQGLLQTAHCETCVLFANMCVVLSWPVLQIRVDVAPAFYLFYATGWRQCTLMYKMLKDSNVSGSNAVLFSSRDRSGRGRCVLLGQAVCGRAPAACVPALLCSAMLPLLRHLRSVRVCGW